MTKRRQTSLLDELLELLSLVKFVVLYLTNRSPRKTWYCLKRNVRLMCRNWAVRLVLVTQLISAAICVFILSNLGPEEPPDDDPALGVWLKQVKKTLHHWSERDLSEGRAKRQKYLQFKVSLKCYEQYLKRSVDSPRLDPAQQLNISTRCQSQCCPSFRIQKQKTKNGGLIFHHWSFPSK